MTENESIGKNEPVQPAQTEQTPPPKAAETAPPPSPPKPAEPAPKPVVTEQKAAEKKVETGKNIERLLDVEMNVTVRFGQTELPLREVVRFGVGSMIELNRAVDEPVELLVNNYPFARGEVVVIDGYYGVKVTEIGSPEERSKTLFSGAND